MNCWIFGGSTREHPKKRGTGTSEAGEAGKAAQAKWQRPRQLQELLPLERKGTAQLAPGVLVVING